MRWFRRWLIRFGRALGHLWGWRARRQERLLSERTRAARQKKYVLTVTRPRADCLCAEVLDEAGPAELPCAICRGRPAGQLRHEVKFVALGEDEFRGLRQDASQVEIDRLGALGLLPTEHREVVHRGQCCPEKPRAAVTGAHVHVLRVVNAAAHDDDVDGRGCPTGQEGAGGPCGGLHLRDLRWYEGALCRFEVLDGPSPADDALRAIVDQENLGVSRSEDAPPDRRASAEPSRRALTAAARPSASQLREGEICQFCYGEHPQHELVDCPGNHEMDEKLL